MLADLHHDEANSPEGLKASGLGLGFWVYRFRDWDLGFRVLKGLGLGFRI